MNRFTAQEALLGAIVFDERLGRPVEAVDDMREARRVARTLNRMVERTREVGGRTGLERAFSEAMLAESFTHLPTLP